MRCFLSVGMRSKIMASSILVRPQPDSLSIEKFELCLSMADWQEFSKTENWADSLCGLEW